MKKTYRLLALALLCAAVAPLLDGCCGRTDTEAGSGAVAAGTDTVSIQKFSMADTIGTPPVAARYRRPDMRVRVLKGDALYIQTEGLSLYAMGESVKRGGSYSVTSLVEGELPSLPQGMVNMTASSAGYRLLPSGDHFSPAAELRVSYDPSLLPEGYTADDIHTSYFDSSTMAWVRLERIGVDTASHEIVSLTTHFTDFINELLKAPEMPETQAFAPTMMSDLEAANPMEGIALMQPPSASQDGSASLSYPLDIPAGRNGMQPSLALTYNSGGGNGWLGVGWDLSVPSITLDTRWGVPRYSSEKETEIYLLNGEQLVNKDANGTQLPLPHRTNQQLNRMSDTVRFFARTGDAHDSIIRCGNSTSNYWWLVVDRTGTRHYYGRYPNGALNATNPSTLTDGNGNIARWMLCESVDPDSNWVRYFYKTVITAGVNPGIQIYLDSISYTGHANENGRYNVVFKRKDRSLDDRPVNCNYGFKEETDKELCHVVMKTMDSVIRSYFFETECFRKSNYKTRLKSVAKLDGKTGEMPGYSKDICPDGYQGVVEGSSVVEFDYHDAPNPSDIFDNEQSMIVRDDNIQGFFFSDEISGDEISYATAFGLSHTSEWNIGGTLAAGLGPDVSNTSTSIGGNYQRAKSHSESLLTLVDLDGDGLSDKLFVRNNHLYWCKQHITPSGTIYYENSQQIEDMEHFLLESGTSNTFGLQGSAGLKGSASWPGNTSVISTYLADVDGDGLVDIMDDGVVYFNRVEAGIPTFYRYEVDPDVGGEDDQPYMNTTGCGGIIFDGEVSDSVACGSGWILTEVSGPMSYEDAVDHCQGHVNNLSMIVEISEAGNGLYNVDHYQLINDCTSRNLANNGLPNTESVRVWVAPEDGNIELQTSVTLIEDQSVNRQLSRHADGVAYTVQHSHDVDTTGGVLTSQSDRILYSYHICADCYDDFPNGNPYQRTDIFEVSKGDVLFFRLRSNSDKQFDDVNDFVSITYVGSQIQYDSKEDFTLYDDRCFQAPFDGDYILECMFSGSGFVIQERQPTGAVPDAVVPQKWGGTITAGEEIRVSVVPTGTNPNWGQSNGKVKIRLYNDNIADGDTLTVWMSGEKDISHPTNSIWGDTTYQRLFGKMYNGWGQFAYSPLSLADSVIVLSSLANTVLPAPSDTAALRSTINEVIPLSELDQHSPDDFMNNHSDFYNPLAAENRWVPMDADAEHGRWVAFGAQSSIGPDTMSNSLQDGWYSTASSANTSGIQVSLPPQIDYDDPIPLQQGNSPVRGVRKVSTSKSSSKSAGWALFGAFGSDNTNVIETDYLDLNGDRYPDIVGSSYVQYRSQWGGMGDEKLLPDGIREVSATTTHSDGYNFGASPVRHERVLSVNPAGAKYTLNGDGSASGSYNEGGDEARSSWIDINGDGLPDYVGRNTVRLNKGYGFLSAEDWDIDTVRTGQSVSKSFDVSGSGSFNKFNENQGSIQLGASVSRSVNRTNYSYVDINGDGLPDRICRNAASGPNITWNKMTSPSDYVHVSFNLGGGRWSPKYALDINNFNLSETYNESLNAGATIGLTILGFKLTFGLNGSPLGGSVSRDNVQLVDINNDGVPDLVSSDNEGLLKVRYNKGGKTNLLKKVTNSTGSRINLEYTLSDPCYEQPSRSWLMTKVTTKDPLNPNGGDTTVTRYSYQHPHYDRLERAFFGYGTVVAEQVNPSNNTVYRIVRRDYHNSNILVKGRPKRELTTDGQGNKYIEKEYIYQYASYDPGPVDTCSGNAYSLRDSIVTRFYEGANTPKFTTAEAYKYDKYHNVVEYFDKGDTAYNDDGLYVKMTYLTNRPNNLVGLCDDFKVYATGTSGANWMRHTTFQYDGHGKKTNQTLYDGLEHSDYDFEYDRYGNLFRVLLPANSSSYRMIYQYTYDAYTHTYPVKIKNSFNDSTITAYNLLFGKPTSVTDPSGATVRYSYDFAGRLLSVKSPLNNSTVPSLEIEYYLANYYHNNTPSTYSIYARNYAVTKHNDDFGNVITETVVITDGFGRVIQTKKGITAGGQTKRQVSGREFSDPFGRTTGRHDPFCESSSNPPGVFNPTVALLIDTIVYDILDRDTVLRQPSMGYTTKKRYDVRNDAAGRRRFTVSVTDPNNHTITQYTDYDGRQVQITDATGGETTLSYDALGQLIASTDPDDFTTTYTYDLLGRLTKREHPDAGTTLYSYDAAGNIIQETNPLGDIFYDYSYNRLDEKRYSGIMENNVTYTYGQTGSEKSRLVMVSDGTGERVFAHDALGNVIREQRTIAVPGCSGVYTFQTYYTYDSWGRILDMTYPDGEVVTYDYTYGGDLVSMYGDKGLEHHDYVTDITYNDYGQRSRIDYDNGAYATYTYDALHRLSALTSVSASGTMQQIQYTMDGVGNINSVSNSATMIGTLGGRYTVDYSYDAMNRLTSAGTRTSATNDAGTFGTGMTYSSSGRLAYKALDAASSLITNSTTRYFAYCDNDKPHAPRRALDTKNDLLSDFLWDDAGNLGQVITAENSVYDRSRFLFWTEDSRLHTVADDDNYSYYAYDYAGERTLKLTGDVSVLENNAERMWVSSALKQLVMYPSPYITITDKGYTKHYYAGSERVCASIGGGMLAAATQNSDMLDRANDLFSSCIEQNSDRVLSTNDNDCLLGLVYNEEPMHVLIKGVPKKLAASINTDLSMFIAKMSYLSTHSDPENDVYFYHADHLGSASWITDKNGVPVQHLQYLPYGERFVDQHTSGYEERYTFTGKEKDSETGYYAFGARYYDCDLSGIFLSVDPMADKYPNISPYAYCAWNPVKLIDPDGRDVLPTSDEAYEMILRTLPSEARVYVQRNSDGYIDRDLINSYECESSNFNDLKTLVNLDCVIEVSISQEFDYLDKDNNPQTYKDFSIGIFVYPEKTQWFDTKGTTPNYLSTGEVGNTGLTQYPESSGAHPSTNEHVKVQVNSLLSPQGRAEVFAHEFFGHAYIYATTGDVHAASHWPAKDDNYQNYDANSRLRTRIINAKREVINNNNL